MANDKTGVCTLKIKKHLWLSLVSIIASFLVLGIGLLLMPISEKLAFAFANLSFLLVILSACFVFIGIIMPMFLTFANKTIQQSDIYNEQQKNEAMNNFMWQFLLRISPSIEDKNENDADRK